MAAPGDLGLLAPDNLDVRQRALAISEFEYSPGDRGTAGIAFAGFDVAEVYLPVFSKIRMQRNVAETSLTAVVDIRNTAYRL